MEGGGVKQNQNRGQLREQKLFNYGPKDKAGIVNVKT
jgi:hypothetical protein